jgi:membrane fusion protein (multidrug efflux system)
MHGALLIPQQAVSELQGDYQVATVDRNNAVNIQTIKVGDQIGSSWVVSEGLNSGDRVIVDGIQKLSPGMHVQPKPSRQKPGA